MHEHSSNVLAVVKWKNMWDGFLKQAGFVFLRAWGHV
jgi:hypothetical protein